jgi:hypothetical protein
MKRLLVAAVALVMASVRWAGVVGSQGKDCKWTFQVFGQRADGKGHWDKEMTVTQRCYAFDMGV